MKKFAFYVIRNTGRLNGLCLFFCLLPMLAGFCLWPWLPQSLICWETTAAAMSGTVTKAGGVLLFPLVMGVFEGFIILLTSKIPDQLVALAVKAILPVFTVCTSAVSYSTGLLGNWLPVVAAYLVLTAMGCIGFWLLGRRKQKAHLH